MVRFWTLYIVLTAIAMAQNVDYGRDVRPILSENCFHCHGQDENKRMANFRLDIPGDARTTRILERITADLKSPRRMPPVYSNRSLTLQQIATIEGWLRQGASAAPHWTRPRI